MSGISVCLIMKNAGKGLSDCLGSLTSFIDRDAGDEIVIVDTGSTDDSVQIAESLGARVIKRPDMNKPGMLQLVAEWLPDYLQKCKEDSQFSDGFISDFAEARTLSFKEAKNDLIFWLDADDILVNGAGLRDACKRFFSQPQNDAVFLLYEYSFDPDGSPNTILWRERVVRRDRFFWKGLCHETLVPAIQGMTLTMSKCDPEQSKLVHKHGRHHVYSDIRNYVILRQAYEQEKWKDPRTEYYLGNACRGLGQKTPGSPYFAQASAWYNRALRRSGSRDDRMAMVLNLGFMLMLNGRYWESIDYFLKATKIFPADPRPFYAIAHAYLELCKYRECLLYTQLGRGIGNHVMHQAVMHSYDPLSLDFQPLLFETLAFQKLEMYPEAISNCDKMIQLRPGFPPVQALRQQLEQEMQKKQILASVHNVMHASFSPEAGREIVQRLRPELRKEIPELQVEASAPPPNPKSITFLCGKTLEPWDPTIMEGPGCGGSEQMVMRMSKAFAKRGYFVDIYGNPTPGAAYKEYDGVTYRPADAFNPKFPREYMILWRHPAFLDHPGLVAKRFMVDMHDVSNPGDWTTPRLQRVHKVIFKSKFHRDTTEKAIPDSKVLISRNGIDLATIPNTIEKIPGKVIWTSSADRGLLGTLRAFAAFKRRRPEAQLTIAYGFTPLYVRKAADQEYQFMSDEQTERHMFDYMSDCFTLAESIGARFLGRLSHKALMEELASSEIWLYPTLFPEISCISAMEALANGCIPVCSDFAALKETVPAEFGLRVDPTDSLAIVSSLDSAFERRGEFDTLAMRNYAHERFSIETLADEWLQELTR